MIRHVLGHHKRILVAPPDQIAHVAWDDIQNPQPTTTTLRLHSPFIGWKTYSRLELSYHCELEGVMIRLKPLHTQVTAMLLDNRRDTSVL